MSEQNKDHIEDFFKKGTQKYDFEYKEQDWKKLEKKLEEAERDGLLVPPRNGSGYWKIGSVIIIALLLAGLFVWKGLAPDNTEVTNEIDTEQNETSKSKVIQPDQIEDSQSKVGQSTESLEKNISSSDDIGAKENNIAGKTDSHSQKTTTVAKNTSQIASGGADNDLDVNKSEDEKNIPAVIGSGQQHRTVRDINYLNSKGLNDQLLRYQLLSNIEGEEMEYDIIDEEEDNYKPFVSMGLYVAPDFSSVGLDDYTRPGKRVGLKFDYSISKRFQVQTGFIYTDNLYVARGSEYNAPSGFWGYGELPMKAEGACEILDIPIGLRYNAFYNDRSRIFLNAGVSSYIMLKEFYEFEYKNYDPGNAESWESQDVTRHIFGLVNVSAGYEHLLAPRWSFQVEPFIKIPITNIGWGNVDLFTVGSYFSLKYYMFRGKGKIRK